MLVAAAPPAGLASRTVRVRVWAHALRALVPTRRQLRVGLAHPSPGVDGRRGRRAVSAVAPAIAHGHERALERAGQRAPATRRQCRPVLATVRCQGCELHVNLYHTIVLLCNELCPDMIVLSPFPFGAYRRDRWK
jgi:hypothetical protein